MGKRSIRANKNIYQLRREELGLTREAASERMEVVSADRIEKIESEKSLPHPDEILLMAEHYQTPRLTNYYCSHECPIGQRFVPEIREKEISQITLELLDSMSKLNGQRNRLVDITVDGAISEDEYEDFSAILEQLEGISLSVDTLKLWLRKKIMSGEIDKTLLEN